MTPKETFAAPRIFRLRQPSTVKLPRLETGGRKCGGANSLRFFAERRHGHRRPRHSSRRLVIGYLSARGPGNSADIIAAFRQGLKEADSSKARTSPLKSRFAEGDFDRLPALAADLVARKVNTVVATGGTVSVVKAKPVVPTTVPIVFAMGGDPVKLGVVASLNRPGENITGVAFLVNGLAGKQMELLHTLVPTTGVIGFLVNPKDPNAETNSKDAQAAAALLGLKAVVGAASIESEIEATLASFAQQHVGALFVDAEPFLLDNRNRILKLAAEAAVPVVSQFRLFAQDGGLASYGTSLTDANPLLGVYTAVFSKARTIRSTGRAVHQVRSGHQSKDSQGPAYSRSVDADGHRRRGDRIASLTSRFGHFSDMGPCPTSVRHAHQSGRSPKSRSRCRTRPPAGSAPRRTRRSVRRCAAGMRTRFPATATCPECPRSG